MFDQWFYSVRPSEVTDTFPRLYLARFWNRFFGSVLHVHSLSWIFLISPLSSKVILLTMLVTKKSFSDITKFNYHPAFFWFEAKLICSHIMIDFFPHKPSFSNSLPILRVFPWKVAATFNKLNAINCLCCYAS